MLSRRQQDLVQDLLALQAAGKTGVMTITGKGLRTVLYLSKGKPVFAEQGTIAETLGRLLVRKNLISEEDYARVITGMTRALEDDFQLRFGDMVVKMGLLSSESVQQALTEQVRAKVVRCLELEEATWVFVPREKLQVAGYFPCSVEPLVLEAARRLPPRRIDAILRPGEERYPKLVGHWADVATRFEMNDDECAFLATIDGAQSIGALLVMGDRRVDAAAILATLAMTGMLELAESRDDRIHAFEVLAPKHTLRVPALHAPPPPARKRRLLRALARLKPKKAPAERNVIAHKHAASDPHAARLIAEHAYQAGRAHLVANRFAEALPELRRASELYPRAIEYELTLAWATYRMHDDRKGSHEGEKGGEREDVVRLRARLRRLAEVATQRAPNFALGHYVLGHLAHVEGAELEAQRHFEHAAKLDPRALDVRQVA
jgi:tetratricopeptide (TPR) repeat protein